MIRTVLLPALLAQVISRGATVDKGTQEPMTAEQAKALLGEGADAALAQLISATAVLK